MLQHLPGTLVPVAALLGVFALAETALGATPVGDEFQVDTDTADTQMSPSVAAEADGDFVVVWQSDESSGSDSSSKSIQGQRYDASGNAVGPEFQINSYTTSHQRLPSVSADSNGDFVVVWQSAGSAGSDNSGYSVQGQRYDASGNTVSSEFQVNTVTIAFQLFPSIGVDSDGDFVVVWQSSVSAGNDNSGSVQGQRYDSSGIAVGSQFQVNSYTTGSQDYASVAVHADGSFVVVWESAGSPGSDSSEDSIQGQRHDAGDLPP